MERALTEQSCKNCRFNIDDYCRRRAPVAARADNYLAEIALTAKLLLWWTMREWSDEKMAEEQLTDFGIKIDEVFQFTQWPLVEPDDWCGEWEARLDQQQAAA
jgi:hypothetical protein